MIKTLDFTDFHFLFIFMMMDSHIEINSDGMDRESQFPEISEFADMHANETYKMVFHNTDNSEIARITANHFGYKVY